MKFKLLLLMLFLGHAALCQDIIEDLTGLILKHLNDSIKEPIEYTLQDTVVNKLRPTIYAICRVELVDGHQVEGILPIVEGGVNGLYFKGGKSDNWMFNPVYHLNLYTVRFTRDADGYTVYRNKGYSDTIHYKNVNKISFMNHQGDARIGSKMTENGTDTKRGRLLEFSNVIQQTAKYYIEDTLDIYQNLAPDTYIRKQLVKSIKVKMADIASLEFLSHPPKRWIQLIKENRISTRNAPEEWRVDSYSNWYHVVVADKRLKEVINDYIKMKVENSGWFTVD